MLRGDQCFTIVPESKRSLAQNSFSNWQLQVLKDDDGSTKFESTLDNEDATLIDTNFYDEIIVEDDQEELNADDATEQNDNNFLAIVTKTEKPTTDQLKWVNRTTKLSYSVKDTEDGCVPIWTCQLCCKICSSSQALRLHLLSKHLVNIAALTDVSKKWLREETQRIQNVLEKSCELCEFSCTAMQTFTIHLIEAHLKDFAALDKIQQQTTTLKSKTFVKRKSSSLEFVAPAKKSKPSKIDWTCQECWFQFSSQRAFDSHMKLHETLKGISVMMSLSWCLECGMFFRSGEDLSSHYKGHDRNQSMLVAADGIALQKTILFKRLAVPAPESGNFNCGHCGRKFEDEVTCKTHVQLHHMNPLICPKDGREFIAMQPFISHLQKAHSDLLPESLMCTHCKKKFVNIYDRMSHTKHCKEKKFACDHCERKFSNKSHLNSHLKRELGLLSCTCPVCEKILKAKEELRIHMRSHTKEKPFSCSICQKSYTTASARASHMETHKDTAIQCEICEVKFIARRHYIVHYKRYHDETYRQRKLQEQTCQHCSKQFLRKDRLKEHILKFHDSELI